MKPLGASPKRFGSTGAPFLMGMGLLLLVPILLRLAACQEPVPFDEIAVPVGSGSGEVAVQGGGLEEPSAWGPNSLVVTENAVYILDSVNARIQSYDFSGKHVGTLSLEGSVMGATDMQIDAQGGFFVLDQNVRVVQIDSSGNRLSAWDVPEEIQSSVTGVVLGQDGEVYLRIEETQVFPLVPAQPSSGESTITNLLAFPAGNLAFSTEEIDPWNTWVVRAFEPSGRDPDTALFEINVQGDHLLASAVVLWIDSAQDFYVSVQEMLDGPTVIVDKTVRKYSRDGRLLGTARVPLEELFARPQREVDVDPQGNIYALIPQQDRILVRRLVPESHYVTFLNGIVQGTSDVIDQAIPEVGVPTGDPGILALGPGALIQLRSTAMSNAVTFRDMTWTCSSANYNKTCANHQRPSWIKIGTNKGMPYKWGGGITRANFLSAMSAGWAPGDVNTSAVSSCSRGQDCSGFVNRCWSYSSAEHPFYTGNLPQICSRVDKTTALQPMDALNSSNHVVLFDRYGSGGVYTIEATTGSYGRVVSLFRSWSYLSNYTGYEYKWIYPNRYYRPALKATFINQSGGRCDQNSPITLKRGATKTVWIDLRNDGAWNWDVNTRLGTTQPKDRASPFYHTSWISRNRPKGVPSGTLVRPGSTHRFSFTVKAPSPSQATTYVEYFNLVQEGFSWFDNPSVAGGPPDKWLCFKFYVTP